MRLQRPTKRQIKEAQKAQRMYDGQVTACFFKVMKEKESFSAEDVFEECRARLVPPQHFRAVSNLFRSMKAAGYIEKTGEFVVSLRNDNHPVTVWRKVFKPEETQKAGTEQPE
jgi:hypothetical protein